MVEQTEMAPSNFVATPREPMETPLTGMRARAVGERDTSALRRSSKLAFDSDSHGISSLAKVGQELSAIAAEFDEANVLNRREMGDLADIMTAVHSYRTETISSLASARAELLASVTTARDATAPIPDRDFHAHQIHEAENEKASVLADIIENQNLVSRQREAINTLQSKLSDTIQQERAARTHIESIIPSLRIKERLFKSLSRAKVYETNDTPQSPCSPDNPRSLKVLKGFVADNENHEVRPFEFDLDRMSEYDVTNAVWEII